MEKVKFEAKSCALRLRMGKGSANKEHDEGVRYEPISWKDVRGRGRRGAFFRAERRHIPLKPLYPQESKKKSSDSADVRRIWRTKEEDAEVKERTRNPTGAQMKWQKERSERLFGAPFDEGAVTNSYEPERWKRLELGESDWATDEGRSEGARLRQRTDRWD